MAAPTLRLNAVGFPSNNGVVVGATGNGSVVRGLPTVEVTVVVSVTMAIPVSVAVTSVVTDSCSYISTSCKIVISIAFHEDSIYQLGSQLQRYL